MPLPVMAEQAAYEQRPTLEFERGSFLTQIGPDLAPDTPALFPKLPANAPRNRLTLARWFFQPGQPLTARVAVNRYWEQLFGTGIVETLEDFGSAGELPSHPELLDWLALHFQNDLHWNMKALVREMVTSATYRQSASTTRGAARERPAQPPAGPWPAAAPHRRDGARPGAAGQRPAQSPDGRAAGDAGAARGRLERGGQQSRTLGQCHRA